MAHRILTVDDSRTVRIIVRNAFKGFACEVLEAGNGAEGIEQARRHKPDLVLLDVTMPIVDGLAMLTTMHGDPELAAIPVVMLTAEGQKSTAEKAAALGSRGYLVKPFTGDALIAEVTKVIPLQQSSPAVAV